MRFKLFGRSGLRVSELCLGTMTFGRVGHADAAESRAIFDAFVGAGGNFIDTAYSYSYETTSGEKLVGELIKADRDHFVVSTKYALSRGVDLVKSGSSRKNMMRSVEESLRRLRSDYIDIYWLHAWDATTPVDEILRGFDDLVSSGKVHYVAVSNTPAWQVSRAIMLAELRGWASFCGIQIEYSLLERTAERELLPMALELGLGIGAWSPLGGGWLSGKYLSHGSESGRLSNVPISERQKAIAELVADIAVKVGSTPSQVALSAIRQMAPCSPIIPILGARTVAQIQDNLGCLNVRLDNEHLGQLDEASKIELGFPYTILNNVRGLAFGGQVDLLDGRGC